MGDQLDVVIPKNLNQVPFSPTGWVAGTTKPAVSGVLTLGVEVSTGDVVFGDQNSSAAPGGGGVYLPAAGGTMTGPILGFEDKGSQLFNVKAWGALGNGTNDDTNAIVLSLTAAVANGGGVVFFPPGSYNTTSTITCLSPLVSFEGSGSTSSSINPSSAVTGDALRVYNPTFNHTSAFSQTFFAGRVTRMTINGTNTTGSASSGLHYGDLMNGRFDDLVIANFTGSISKGLWMDNVVGWCERMTWTGVQIINCTSCLVFDVNSGASSGSGYSSFAYSDYGTIKLAPLANQDGMVIKNGALVNGVKMNIVANCGQSLSGGNTGALYRQTGSSTSAGGLSYSSFLGDLSIFAETDWDGGSGTTPHQTIYVDSNYLNRFVVGTGTWYFLNGWTATNLGLGGSAATFLASLGYVYGDSNISDSGSYASQTLFGGSAKALGVYPSTGELYVSTGDVFDFGAMYQNVTVTFSGSAPTLPREVTVYARQAASGGPYTITWPSAPLLLWVGGSVPTMTTTAGHTDIYILRTSGNGIWIGQALQNAH